MRIGAGPAILAMVTVLVLLMLFWSTTPLTTSAQVETTPPEQPSGLSTEVGDTQVRLSWDDPQDTSITNYQLWQIAQSATLTGTNDEFGYSVAVVGDIAVVGMPDDKDDSGDDPGEAFVFSRSADVWALKYKLKSDGAVQDDGFGTSVAFDGETIVVGAPFDEGNVMGAGAAYVFTKPLSGWAGGTNTVDLTETAKLTASDGVGGVEGDQFGNSVAVDGDTVVVGADWNESTKGAAYVFTKPTGSSWASTNTAAKLTASDGKVGDYFGNSVAIDVDTIVVGAPGNQNTVGGTDVSTGAAYVFTKPGTGWATDTQTAKLTASDRAENDEFGYSVALDGDTIVVGAPGNQNTVGGTDVSTGAAYVFTKPGTGWATDTQTAKLTASDRADDDEFGYSVAVGGDTVVVGAYADHAPDTDSGSAYVFIEPGDGWADGIETAKLTPSDGGANHKFGSSVAIDGDTVVVGAENKDAKDVKAAYVFDVVNWQDIAGSNAATTSHIVTGLTNDVAYPFRVRAVNTVGASDPSDYVSATPKAAAYAPARPRNFSATQTGDGEVELTWDAHRYPLTVTGYEYNQDDGGGPNWTDIDGSDYGTVSHTVTGLGAGDYTFAVRAVNNAGSTESDSQSITAVGKSAAPDSFSAVGGDGHVWLGWRTPLDSTISGYEYQQKEGPGAFGDWQTIPGSRSGTTFHIVTGLTNGTAYTFQVRAVNAAGKSDWSGEQSATPVAASSAPVKPEGFSARQTGDGQVELTWDASTDPLSVAGYQYIQNGGSGWTTILGSNHSTDSHTINGLALGNYRFGVRAVNSVGATTSDYHPVTVFALPGTPNGLAATAGDTQVGLTWNELGDASVNKFQLSQEIESIRLIANAPAQNNDELGWSVAVDGDTLVIGALGDDNDDPDILNVGAAYVFTRVGGGWTQAGKLTARDRKKDAGFGHAVAVHGDTIVVGAYEEDHTDDTDNLDDFGAAYVFTKPATGWADMTQTARLTASDAAANDEFGASVAVHGDTIVVGAPEEDTGARGSAYIFTKPANGWADMTQTATLRGTVGGDRFGRSVDLHGDTVVVGAYEENNARGAAYIFTKSAATGAWDDWHDKEANKATAKLIASDGASGDRFGRAVAMDGDTIVVGARYNDSTDDNTNDVSNSGAAYVFTKPDGGWDDNSDTMPNYTETAKFLALDRAENDEFGFSVAVEGDTVVVGAHYDDDPADSGAGAAYVFKKSGGFWGHAVENETYRVETDKLTAYDRSNKDRFGHSVAVDGDTVLVGAVGDNSVKGSAYVFGTPAVWADIPGSGAATVAHIATGLLNDRKYTFQVRAVTAAGAGAASNSASATPKAAEAAPAAPATRSAEQTGDGLVELRWDAPTYPLTVTGYQYTQNGGSNWSDISGSDSGTVSHIVSGLMVDTMYTFAVRAVNSGTLPGLSSSFRDVTIVGEPRRPTGLGTTSGDTQATFHWNVTDETTDRPIVKHQLLHLPQSKLTADDGADDDEFGYSVAIDGNTAVVGAPGSNTNAGAAYVFTKDSDDAWSPAATLTASDGAANDEFGISVAIDGNTIVVGARQDDTRNGAAYVFTKSPDSVWANDENQTYKRETAKLTASDAAADDKFGISVAIDGNTIVVGARQDDTRNGAAYVFTKADDVAWANDSGENHKEEAAKLIASDGAANDELGISVAIDGDTVVAGAHLHDIDDNGSSILNAGAAYVFTKPTGGWTDNTKGAKFTAPDGAADDEFGISVAINVDTVVVGAHNHDANSTSDAGAAYVFTRDSNSGKWGQPLKLTASNGHADDGFGNSVAVDGNTAVVGAYLDDRDNAARDTGSTYVFARKLGVWSQTLNLAGPGPDQNDRLGYSVAVDDGTLLAGAPQDANDPGFAYAMDISDAEWTDFGSTELTDNGEDYFYRVLNLTNDQEYAFRVRSVNAAANRPSNETVAATPKSAKPGKTDGLSAQPGDSQVTLSWDDPRDSSLTGYQVLRPPEQTKFTAGSDGERNGAFGASVAVDDAAVVVGAPKHNVGSKSNAGAAYVFTEVDGVWSGPIELTAGSDGAENDWFGYSVAVEGNVAVIGAYQHDTNDNADAGAAYVFIRDPLTGVWSEPVKLIADDGAENDWFGYSVAVDGETIVVGARWHNGKAGAAYVFARNSMTRVWGNDPEPGETHRVETAKLTASDGGAFNYFGHSVAVDGETIVIGAPGYNANTGVSYVFARNSMTRVWGNDPEPGETHRVETAKLTASNGHADDGFGNSVAVDGNTAVVGAQQDDGERGSAYVFTEPTGDGGWADNTEMARLAASDSELGDHFGNSVAVRGGSIVVGAYTADIDPEDKDDARSGAAYLFTRPENGLWANHVNEDHRTESGKLILPIEEGAVENSDEFGNSVALDGQRIVVGAPESNDGFGSVYVSDIPQWDFLASGAETTSTTVEGLTNGVEYTFQVRAVDDFGMGPGSDSVRAMPMPVPAAPTNFTATAYDAMVRLTWDNPVDSSSDWYQYRQAVGDRGFGSANRIPKNEKATTEHTVIGLSNGVTYTFQVRAVNKFGAGDWSASSSARLERPIDPSGDDNGVSLPPVVNSPPSFGSDDHVAIIVEENTLGGAPVGTPLTATDPDGDTLSYSLSGTGASYFVIDGSTGQITVASGATLDYETGSAQYTVVVSVHDGKDANGNADTTIDDSIEVTIVVNNVDEAGTVSVLPVEPEVGMALTGFLTDPDGSVSNVSWQWAKSSDGSNWSDISGAGFDVYTPVADDAGSHLRATASYTDRHGPGKTAHGVSGRQTTQGSPSFQGDAAIVVEENTPGGAPVGTPLTATDPEGDALSYSLSGTGASSFFIDGSTGQITVASGATLDYETGSAQYTVVVSVHDGKDANGNADTTIDDSIEVTIVVNNVDDAGTVSVLPVEPEVGKALTGFLTDPDGRVSNVSWQWAKSSDGSNWSDISGAGFDVYTPVADDAGSYLRATASYTDGHGPGKTLHGVSGRQTTQGSPSFQGDVAIVVEEDTPGGAPVGTPLTATPTSEPTPTPTPTLVPTPTPTPTPPPTLAPRPTAALAAAATPAPTPTPTLTPAPTPEPTPPPVEPSEEGALAVWLIVLVVAGAVLVIGGVGVYAVMQRR